MFELPPLHFWIAFVPPAESLCVCRLAAVGREWADRCVERYPEILWLADADVRKTEEGHALQHGSYSEQMFGRKFVEFDRTLMTLHCLRLILDGSEGAYLEFSEAQPEPVKCSRQSFEALRRQAMDLLSGSGLSQTEMGRAMETALVLGDIGKSERARDVFRSYGADAPDHDDFHGQVMGILRQHPHLCPSFEALSAAAKELLFESANLAHYGHITHLEGGFGMFDELKKRAPGLSRFALDFDLFVHTCDVAGALGHLNNRSSIAYTEETYRALEQMKHACRMAIDPKNSAEDCYNDYLAARASWLGLDSHRPEDRFLARIGAMLRLFTPQDGALLKQAFSSLSAETQEFAVKHTLMGGRTATYMPAVLVNLANHPQLGKTREERLAQAVVLGVPFLAKVLERQMIRLEKGEADPTIPLNFNPIAGLAKTAPFSLQGECAIDRDGMVTILGDKL